MGWAEKEGGYAEWANIVGPSTWALHLAAELKRYTNRTFYIIRAAPGGALAAFRGDPNTRPPYVHILLGGWVDGGRGHSV